MPCGPAAKRQRRAAAPPRSVSLFVDYSHYRMAILQRRKLLEFARQVKNDIHQDDQNAFYTYVTGKMPAQARTNLAKALERGGNAARSTVSQALSTWLYKVAVDANVPISSLAQRKGGGDGGDGARRPAPIGKGRGAHQAGTSTTTNGAPTTSTTSQPTTSSTRGPKGGAKGGGNATRKGSGKGQGRSTPWADLVISPETPLAHPDGTIAKKVQHKEADSDDVIEKYDGYIMAASATARKLIWRLAKRQYSTGDVVVVQPALSQNDQRVVEDTLKEWETQINDDRAHGSYISLGVTPASLIVHDPITGEDDAREVIIIHLHEDQSIYPVDSEGARQLGLTVAPELECSDDVDEDVIIDIIKPLCIEAGMEEWVNELFGLQDRKDVVKAVQKILNEGRPDPEVRVRVIHDRTIKFRGQVMPEARIRAIVTVPPQRVDSLLARSGQSGIIVEHANRDKNDAYQRIKMPLEASISDCNTAIASLPPPTFAGRFAA